MSCKKDKESSFPDPTTGKNSQQFQRKQLKRCLSNPKKIAPVLNNSIKTHSNPFEIQNLGPLLSRDSSEQSFKRENEKPDKFFNAANIFSAFKSRKDYMIAECGNGYVIFVDGKLKKSDKQPSKLKFLIKFQFFEFFNFLFS